MVSLWIHMIYSLKSFRITSLALGQSYDCPSASEVILKDMGKNHPLPNYNKTHKNMSCVYTFQNVLHVKEQLLYKMGTLISQWVWNLELLVTILECKKHPVEYAHDFVVHCFMMVKFLENSYGNFTNAHFSVLLHWHWGNLMIAPAPVK